MTLCDHGAVAPPRRGTTRRRPRPCVRCPCAGRSTVGSGRTRATTRTTASVSDGSNPSDVHGAARDLRSRGSRCPRRRGIGAGAGDFVWCDAASPCARNVRRDERSPDVQCRCPRRWGADRTPNTMGRSGTQPCGNVARAPRFALDVTRGVTGFAHAGEITAATQAHRNDARAAIPVHALRAAATRLAFAFEKPSIWIGGSWGPKPAWEKDASACTSPPTTKAMPFEGGGRPNRFLESRSIRPSPCFVSVSSTAHVPGRTKLFVARAAFTSRHMSTAAPSANRLWRSVRPLFKTTDAPVMSPADGAGASSEPSATTGRTLNERGCRYRSGAKRSRSLWILTKCIPRRRAEQSPQGSASEGTDTCRASPRNVCRCETRDACPGSRRRRPPKRAPMSLLARRQTPVARHLQGCSSGAGPRPRSHAMSSRSSARPGSPASNRGSALFTRLSVQSEDRIVSPRSTRCTSTSHHRMNGSSATGCSSPATVRTGRAHTSSGSD